MLSLLSFVLLSTTVNLLAASLALSGFLGYVFVYTVWLKRRTPQNIVIGGAAGAVPPLVGWAAVHGSVGGTAVILFFIVFFWTPPHFWALSLILQKDYQRAGVPMLPVVRGERETRRQILLYTLILLVTSLGLVVTHGMGAFYLVAALLLGCGLVALGVRLATGGRLADARRFFWFSNYYLALLFAVMVLDRVLR